MIDVQNQPGYNEIDIDKVGVCDVTYPIEVLGLSGTSRHSGCRFHRSPRFSRTEPPARHFR